MTRGPDLFGHEAPERAAGSDAAAVVSVETVRVSPSGAALLVSDGTLEAWIAWSLIAEDPDDIEVPSPCQEITIPEWLAVEKGLA